MFIYIYFLCRHGNYLSGCLCLRFTCMGLHSLFQSKTLNIFMIFSDENAKENMLCNARIKYG